MDKNYWSSTDISRLYRLQERTKSMQTLFNAEERREIPIAKRIPRGSTSVRQWTIDQLPAIGEKFGFLKKPINQKIICVYTAKGGVLKTTLAYTLARILALNGIKILMIGLDIQCSITDMMIPKAPIDSLEENEKIIKPISLYHFIDDKVSVKDIIKVTSLPTLDVIPESSDLNLLEKRIHVESRKEYLFKDKLIPELQKYDVIIFDNGPSWNQLIENALTASQIVISPVGCDIGTYQSLQTNLKTTSDFQKKMRLEWEKFLLIPTLLEKTKLSQQIYGAYLRQYPEQIIPIPIRRAVKGQEATLVKRSAIEHAVNSGLSQDYFELIKELWNKVRGE